MRVQLDPGAVLREIEVMSQKRFLPIIGPVKGRYLAETVRDSGARRVLEVGTLVGYSAILIASNLPADGRVETIEQNPQSAETAKENIRKAGLSGKINVHTGNALEVIPGLTGRFDLVFLDATKNEYLDYLKLCEGMLKKQGIVFADNAKVFAGEMREYLEYVRNSGRYSSRFIDVGFDGVEISIKLF